MIFTNIQEQGNETQKKQNALLSHDCHSRECGRNFGPGQRAFAFAQALKNAAQLGDWDANL